MKSFTKKLYVLKKILLERHFEKGTEKVFCNTKILLVYTNILLLFVEILLEIQKFCYQKRLKNE